MTRSEIFATVKEANALVDRMESMDKDTQAYADLSDALYWTLECFRLVRSRGFALHMSKRTGHYYVTFE